MIPDLIVHDGAAFASSLDVARVFGKRHDDVVRKLRNIVAQEPECARSFTETSRQVPGPNGGLRDEPCFEITRDGFTLLAMGFAYAKYLLNAYASGAGRRVDDILLDCEQHRSYALHCVIEIGA